MSLTIPLRLALASCVASDLWSTTATIQYKIWKGLVGRLEYRHDQSDERVFRVRYSVPDRTTQGLLARGKRQDTISLSLYYSFFYLVARFSGARLLRWLAS